MNPSLNTSSLWSLTTEMTTSASTSTSSDSGHIIGDIISMPPTTFTVGPSPTRRSSSDFVYVEYDDYDEYTSYENPSISSEPDEIVPTTASTTTRRPRKTAPPHLLKKTTTTPTMLPVITAGSLTTMVVQTSAVPEFSTTMSPDSDDVIDITSSEEWGLQTEISLIETEPTPTSSSSSSISLSKKENNSVDRIPYRIPGLDSDTTRGQQNYFVLRMPPIRERTQNKRIQELLNEKRRQDLLRRSSRSRTDRKHTGL